jgi:hypothetical protein
LDRRGQSLVEIDEPLAGPKFAFHIVTTHYRSSIPKERDVRFRRLRRSQNLAPLFAQLARAHVDLVAVEPDD